VVDPSSDTIVALSSGSGRAALAVIRLTGPSALVAVDGRFEGRRPLIEARGHTLHTGHLKDVGGANIDEVVAAVYRAPHSYTGEDVVEISCHGNPVIVEQVLASLVGDGVRLAEPGEFTRRAYLNGRIDLAQAEAVSTLIAARTGTAARAALRQLHGDLSDRVGSARGELVGALATLEATIDFPDEDLSAIDAAALRGILARVADSIAALHRAAQRGRPLAETTTVVIAGAPNVGKSSIFNALLGRSRSIVHPEPGTTRDVVDAELVVGQVPVRLVDTAGLTETGDAVEAEGIRRSRTEQQTGDHILIVLDAAQPEASAGERALLDEVDPERTVIAVNKIDLGRRLALSDPGPPWVEVSARTGVGLDELTRRLEASILGGPDDPGDVLVTGLRQERALGDAATATAAAVTLLETQPDALELVAEEPRGAANALGLITGERVGEDLLDVIFSEFCIGK